jgi:hypothetical protein
VEWHYYKAYLLKYLEKNAAKNLSGEDALHDAVNRVSSSILVQCG